MMNIAEEVVIVGNAAATALPAALAAAGFSRQTTVADDRALAAALAQTPAAPVVIAAAKDKNATLAAVAAALTNGSAVYVAAALLPDLAPFVPVTKFGDDDFILFPAAKRTAARAVTKWLMDKVIAAAFVLILLPIWLPMFAAIKMDSRGPIIFRQKRLTLGRREFNIYKFRTMFATVPQYQLSPTAGDDVRVTRLGRLLRRLGLDETAQLINVLKGQMSLVGPRPEMAVVAAEYEPWQNLRFQAKPGITGLWQVAGRADRPIAEGLEFDIYYLARQSLALDIKIIIKTIPILLGKGKRH